MVLEIIIIDVQAWRGTTSHFNVGTLVDGVLFTIMGLAIVVQTIAATAVAVHCGNSASPIVPSVGAPLRDDDHNRRAATGGLMTQPTREQLDRGARRPGMKVAGAPLGAPDGGPGLPGTGWSREHAISAWRISSAFTRYRCSAGHDPVRQAPWQTCAESGRLGDLRVMSRCLRCCCGRRCGPVGDCA